MEGDRTSSIAENRWFQTMVLERVGFFDAMRQPGHRELPDVAMNGDFAFDNPKLLMLRDMYDRFCCPALIHSQWNLELRRQIAFDRFRGESPYMWQVGDGNLPLHLLATFYYLRNSSFSDVLEACVEDDRFGVQGVSVGGEVVSRDRLDSVSELGFLREAFGLNRSSKLNILDIGSGYGRLGWRIYQCYPSAHVICADAIPESSFLCDAYLRFRGAPSNIRMVPLPNLEAELSERNIDLALAVNSFTECTAQAVQWWLDLLCEYNIPYLLIVPHAKFGAGIELYTQEVRCGDREAITPFLEARGFKRRILAPKYSEPTIQRYGVSPTYYHLFERVRS